MIVVAGDVDFVVFSPSFLRQSLMSLARTLSTFAAPRTAVAHNLKRSPVHVAVSFAVANTTL